jgi:hypothetical protein
MRFSAVLALVLSLYLGRSQSESCPTIMHDLHTWDALYTSFKSYRQCDDGAVGEGYSESVARILVDRWNTLPQLSRLVRKDTEFRPFVLKHVDATLDIRDVRRIRTDARTRCPAGLNEICNDLTKQADTALRELH